MMISARNGSQPFCLDANVLITAWNTTYPFDVLPTLWSEMANKRHSMILLKPIYEEIKPRDDELKKWLESNNFSPTDADSAAEKLFEDLRSKYGVGESSEPSQSSAGVGVNDLTLIAYAQIHEKIVVTLEAQQDQLPKKKRRYKIPAVCEQEQVACIDFVEMLRRLKIKV